MEASARVIIGDSRSMPEITDGAVDLVVTSPPYWHIKDYGVGGQIGYGQTLHEYLKDLYRVWRESYRVLRPGGRMCVNIGDQFARTAVYGRYKVIPLHAEIISQCERIGFDFMGSIIWQKKTTMNTTGGASVMGSFPYPPNGIVEIDYEFIHIMKKPGAAKAVPPDLKEASKLSITQWKEYFAGHWRFGGARQVNHEAMFPEELPRRLLRMFSFVGDTVLDPFLGSGTTVRVALELGRNVIGYEINPDCVSVIREKLALDDSLPAFAGRVEITRREAAVPQETAETDYVPAVKDAKPVVDPSKFNLRGETLYRVATVVSENRLVLDTGLEVAFAGVRIEKGEETLSYLKDYVLGKEVFLKLDEGSPVEGAPVQAYVYLKNRIFINGYLVKSGLASPDAAGNHRLKAKLVALWKERRLTDSRV